MAVVRELITRFGWSVEPTTKIDGAINRISGLLSGIAALASIRALANVADSMQSLEARIGMLPQTIGDVGKAFNEVSLNASANRQSIEAYGAFYTKVGNAAKGLINDQSQLLKVTNTISQALVVGGASTQEAQAAMMQFGQALGSGVLQGDEFRSMAEAAPQYLDALSEAMNIPRENLKKMASEGKLTSKAVIESTLKMSSMFEDKFRRMPMTIGQATTIMGNRFKTMVAGMNRETQIVTDVANILLSAFDRIEAGFNGVVNAVGGTKNALKLLGIAAAALLGPIALGGLVSVLAAILSPAGLVVGALILVGVAIDDVLTYLDGGQSTFGDFIAWMKSGSAGAAVLHGALTLLGSLLVLYAVYLGALAKAWVVVQFAALKAAAASALAWAVAAAPVAILIAAIALAVAAFGAAAYLIYTHWESIKQFASSAVKSIGEVVLSLGAIFKNIFYDTPIKWISEMIPRAIEKLKAIGASALGAIGVDLTAPSVAPSSIATAGKAGNVVTSNQTVNLTVPPGTPESQQKFLQDAAGTAFQNNGMDALARNLGMVGT